MLRARRHRKLALTSAGEPLRRQHVPARPVTERQGLGTTNNRQPGFFGHFALALDPSAANRPVGLLGMTVFSRTKKKYSRATRAAYERKLRHDPTNESLRWGDLVEAVESDLQGAKGKAIHVMDRESDGYVLIARMHAIGARFVIRATAKRRLFSVGPGEPLDEEREAWRDFPDILDAKCRCQHVIGPARTTALVDIPYDRRASPSFASRQRPYGSSAAAR